MTVTATGPPAYDASTLQEVHVSQSAYWFCIGMLCVIGSAITAVGEWRTYRRSGRRAHVWGACSMVLLGLVVASFGLVAH